MIQRQSGSTLASLMIAAGVAMVIALSALRLMAQSHQDYGRTEEVALIDEQVGYALEIIGRSLQQAGHVDANLSMPILPARPFDGAVIGMDNSTVAGGTPAIDSPLDNAHLGSDLLMIRFAGDAAGRMSNCAGFSVSPPVSDSEDAGISIFHVSLDASNQPELRCKYRGSSQWSSQAIASGVESFQVLFGMDTDGDGLPNDFVSATRLASIDAAAVSSQPSLRTRIVAVEIALLMRSARTVKSPSMLRSIDLFGRRYAERHQNDDPGTHLKPEVLKSDYLHRHYDAVIFLNNSLRPDA
jgi:type IV pilus assembly protein PilW